MRRLTALILILALLLCGCGDRLPSQTSEPAPSPSAEPSIEPSVEPSVAEKTEEIRELLKKNLTVGATPLSVDLMLICDENGETRYCDFVGVYGGTVNFWVVTVDDFAPVYSVEPRERMVESFQDGFGGHIADTSEPGKYFYTADVRYKFDNGYTASVTYNAWVHVLGEPVLTLDTPTVRQGDLLPVVASGGLTLDEVMYTTRGSELLDYPKKVPPRLDSFDYELYLPHTDSTQPMVPRDGEKLYAVAQISVAAEPGDYTMELRRSRNGGEPETIATADYRIEAREFDRQDLVTSSSTQSIYTSDNVNSDNEKMRAARSNSNPQPYFKGLFSCPLPDGWVLTTEFGQQRYVSGKFQSRHAARDMAAPLGTDVYATAPGVVTFAGELIVNGNTIVIDHGAGIFSSYSHLSAIDVEEGDFVDQGALIGLVGSTGYSTGPHLHFGLVASGYYVDPLYPQEHDLLAVLDPLEE